MRMYKNVCDGIVTYHLCYSFLIQHGRTLGYQQIDLAVAFSIFSLQGIDIIKTYNAQVLSYSLAWARR